MMSCGPLLLSSLTETTGLTLSLHEGKDVVLPDRPLHVPDDRTLVLVVKDHDTHLGNTTTRTGTANHLLDLGKLGLVTGIDGGLLLLGILLDRLSGGGHFSKKGLKTAGDQ
eukprot:TRINITY_DN187_c1_g1_i3.p1 TRINITY_DN187_c1_g1~~TRINITY_DN187_c1_g1_i3.p1  ORF type:complete len:111 (-),score=0.53 TRINITY_DN187_c1_g1_i3:25-357(-)